MALSPFDPLYDSQAAADAHHTQQQIEQYKTTADPAVSQRISEIYKQHPYIPPSIILSMAKAGTSQDAVNAIAPAAGQQAQALRDPTAQKKDGWFQSHFVNNFKAVSRWTFATLQLIPDMAQNLAAQAFSPTASSNGLDGFFRSTHLGTMLAAQQGKTMDVVNPDGTTTKQAIDVGSGFFEGGNAVESQAEKTRQYRGTINGHAWTVGRGAASLAFTPGSKPYSLLSGLIDAGVNYYTDPTTYIGPYIKELRTAKAAIPALTGAEAISAAKKLANGEAGLTAAESLAYDSSKFSKFFATDPRAQRAVEGLTAIAKDVADPTTRTTWQAGTEKIIEAFNGKISPELAKEFATAKSPEQIKAMIAHASARLETDINQVVLPQDIRGFGAGLTKASLGEKAAALGAPDSFVKALDSTVERMPLWRNIRNSKWFEQIPKGQVVIGGSGIDRSDAIINYSRYFKAAGISEDSAIYRTAMDKITHAYSLNDPAVARDAIHEAYSNAISTAFQHAGASSKNSKEVVAAILEKARQELNKVRVYTVDEAGNPVDGGFLQMMRSANGGIIDDADLAHFPAYSWDNLVVHGPGSLGELADEMHVLPDFRKLRRLAGTLNFATANSAGDLRKPLQLAEFLQNDIWKPLSLATGGYMMRTMGDTQMRIAMTGLDGLFNHPFDYMDWVAKRGRGFADILGKNFEKDPEATAQAWAKEQPEFVAAQSAGVHAHLNELNSAYDRGATTGNFTLISRGADPEAHTIGYVDNLALIHADPINRRIAQIAASGEGQAHALAETKAWLSSPEAAADRQKLIDYFKQGVKVIDPENPNNVGYVKFSGNIDDEAMAHWVDRLSTTKINTVVKNDNELRIVAAHNRVPITIPDQNGHFVAVRPEHVDPRDVRDWEWLQGKGEIGSIIHTEDGLESVVIGRGKSINGRIISANGSDLGPSQLTSMTAGRDVLITQPVHPGPAFTKDTFGSKDLRQLINNKGNEGVLAETVKRAERGMGGEAGSKGQKILEMKDHFTDKIFRDLFGTATAKLSESPVFRQFYYKEVGNTVEHLAQEEAQKLLDNIKLYAGAEGTTPEKYVGGKDILAKIEKAASQPPSTTVLLHGSPTNDLTSITPQLGGARGPNQKLAWGWSTAEHDLDTLANEAYKHATKTGVDGSIYITTGKTSALHSVSAGTGTLSAPSKTAQALASTEPLDVLHEIKVAGKSKEEVIKEIKNFVSSVPKNTNVPTGTIEQLDDYAKALALQNTKKTLFDHVSRNNLVDTLRIVMPFGAAFQQHMSKYAEIIAEDPTRIRRAQLLFDGMTKADSGIIGGHRGEGFFYKDPATGKYVFNLPASGWLTKLMTGVEAPMQAPVQGLSMAFHFNPHIGPAVQVLAANLIPDTPKTDWIVHMFMPYGKDSAGGIMPKWASDFNEAVRGNTTNLETVYANTYMETLRALSTSGEYDLSNVQEKNKLFADAKTKAKVIAGLRAIGQFMGPSSPQADFNIHTDMGDVYASQLTQAFHKFQSENYDTAVQKFLETYGNDAILYLSNKTQSVAGGLEASKEFGDWERNNGKLLKNYPDTAAYMAPTGTDFDFTVWQRQLRSGARTRLTDKEMIDAAQYKAAEAQYRALREKLPANPSAAQAAWLRDWRVELNRQYPGFPAVSQFNPGKFPQQVQQMKQLIQEPSLKDNEVAQALGDYLYNRDQAVAKYIQAGGAESGFGTAAAAAPLREWLMQVGKSIKAQTPEFGRIYDRVLSYEVEK